MASEQSDSLSEYDNEQLILYGRSKGIVRARSMRRDTLYCRLKEQHDNEADLIDSLNAYINNQQPNNNNNNNDQKSTEVVDSAENDTPTPIKLYITVSAHPVNDEGNPVSAPTMQEWARKFKKFVMETKVDENEEIKQLKLKDKLADMEQPFDSKNNTQYVIQRLSVGGVRFDMFTFERSADKNKDRQYMTNKVNNIESYLKTAAGKNECHLVIFASDTTTRALIEDSHGTVRRKACYMKVIGDDFEFKQEHPSYNKLVNMWKNFTEISDDLVEIKKKQIAEEQKRDRAALQQRTNQIAQQQKMLMDKLESSAITQQEFNAQFIVLNQNLLQTTSADNDED